MNNAEFRKYSLYAFGEMALVVVGILVALQIDNWNAEKLEQRALKNYLQTIARNVESDMRSIDRLREERIDANELGVRWWSFATRNRAYTVPEVDHAGRVIDEARTLRYFDASSSGYEALKASGAFDQMQGTDVELLLYDYYDTVARIARFEQTHNQLARLLSLQLVANWPEGIERWELELPDVLTSNRFTELQPSYRRVLENYATYEMVNAVTAVGPVLRDYDRLDHLGRAFLHLVEIDSMNLDATAKLTLDGIHDPSTGLGQRNLITDGQVAWDSFHFISSDANDPKISYEAASAGLPRPFDINSFQRVGDSVRLGYGGGTAWAGMWLIPGALASDRLSPDYSAYDQLLLEAKGDIGGEIININIEDRDDPHDGTSTKVQRQLTDQWQTYEIDLSEFETADTSMLDAIGFTFYENPQAFSIRTLKFVKATK